MVVPSGVSTKTRFFNISVAHVVKLIGSIQAHTTKNSDHLGCDGEQISWLQGD